MILLACDLDNTLIHGKNSCISGDICVEYLDGKEISFISAEAYKMLNTLDERICLVPVTARSIEQYKRLNIFKDKIPKYAITSCGAVILCNGEVDTKWQNRTNKIVQSVCEDIKSIFTMLEKDKSIFKLRIIDTAFIFAMSNEDDKPEQLILDNIYAKHFSLFRSHKKLYLIPNGINKGVALTEVRNRINKHILISAGDSILDIPILEIADYALIPSDKLVPNLHSAKINIKMNGVDFASWIFMFAKEKAEEIF